MQRDQAMRDNETNNQQLLTDYVLGRLDPQTEQQVRRRTQAEPELKRACDDIRNTFSAMDLAIQAEPPADLVTRTMARIRSARQTDALLAREQLTRRDVIRPTFSIREIAAVAQTDLNTAHRIEPDILGVAHIDLADILGPGRQIG